MNKPSRYFRIRLLHLWIAVTIAFVIASRLIPEGGSIYFFMERGGMESECLMRRLTGLSCGTCGMTGAFSAIARYKFDDAILRHPLSIPLYFSLIALGTIALCDLIGMKKISTRWIGFYESNRRNIVIGIIILFLSIYIIRICSEIEAGYYKPGGFEKLFFLWFFIFHP